jgi:hypothetical protein
MISVFAEIPRLSASLVVKGCLVCFLTLSAFVVRAQQDNPDRPHLSHQTQPIDQSESPIDLSKTLSAAAASGTPIGDGLVLPSVGHVWARDSFGGQPQLVQMKYVPTEIDRHAASNILKANMAPFIYKPKQSIEIKGAAANVRLHDPKVSIYIRGYAIAASEDAAESPETSTQMDLTLVKAQSNKDRRIVSTIAFTQVTGKADRSNQTIGLTIEKLGTTDWQKLTPSEPLQPGEYVLMCMPRGQNLFPTRAFDFAIDPKAPASSNAILPATATPSR